jgi:tetratricopeptide (TPR) repeat protein
LDNIPENASSISGASGLGIEDYMINFLNKNLALPDSGANSPRLDVQSPQFMQQRPAPPVMRQLLTPALLPRMPSPPPAPRVQSPILSASPVPTTQSTTSDAELIQQWRLSGSRNFATGDYGRAQMLLEQVIKGSETMFGDDYAWRAETKSLLAETCIRLGRWDEAGKIFTEKYDGREAQIDSVANGFLRERQWDKLTWVLQQKFSGRETIMEAASRALILDQKWAEAKEMLVGLMTYKKEDCARGLERMYLLAEVCWSRKDLGDAKQMCITAIESQNSILQRSDPLYSQFVKLAIQICDAQNEREQAEKFRSLLSFGVAGTTTRNI